MKHLTRRDCLRDIGRLSGAVAFTHLGLAPAWAFGDDQLITPNEAQLASMDRIARDFMNRCRVPALSVAISRHGQFVYRKAFGLADQGKDEKATPASLFRIASVSKPVTSIAIFTLIEQNRLKLSDFVFGRNGVVGFDYGSTYPDLVQRITVEHLLTHTCGGWPTSGGGDAMFGDNDMSVADLIKSVIHEDPLQYEPGTHWAYSNFGYCILGRVIEKISGQTYEQFVQQSVLVRCGVRDMRIARNSLEERAAGEVVYYGGEENAYVYNVRRMDSHGGWIASPSDLVQVAMHVDGFSYIPNILKDWTIYTMTEPCPVSPTPHYAKGWFVNDRPNWWHMGSLPGATAILIRTATGFCWAALVNTRTEEIDLALDRMMWALVAAVPEWHENSH